MPAAGALRSGEALRISGRNTAMAQVGTGKYTYEVIRDFFKSPDGEPFGLISRVAADAQDRIYVFQRRNPPVVVFDRDGKRSEEHTSELQSRFDLVCRLLLEKKNLIHITTGSQ